MKYKELLEKVIKQLPFNEKQTVLKFDGLEIFLLRPSKLSRKFVTYDPKKNFQIWLKGGEREFRPNHLRVFIDLYLRSKSRPDLKKELLTAFDSIFYGEDPDIAISNLGNENFEHFLNPLRIIAYLSQLFIAEQDYGYHRESKYDPATLFYQGWIRQSIAHNKEIDNICMSIANGQPPMAKFTYLEDKKHKKFDSNFKSLWYLEELVK
jgi:hypothetical protein